MGDRMTMRSICIKEGGARELQANLGRTRNQGRNGKGAYTHTGGNGGKEYDRLTANQRQLRIGKPAKTQKIGAMARELCRGTRQRRRSDREVRRDLSPVKKGGGKGIREEWNKHEGRGLSISSCRGTHKGKTQALHDGRCR